MIFIVPGLKHRAGDRNDRTLFQGFKILFRGNAGKKAFGISYDDPVVKKLTRAFLAVIAWIIEILPQQTLVHEEHLISDRAGSQNVVALRQNLMAHPLLEMRQSRFTRDERSNSGL